jgi:hypothetical protein
MRRSHCSSARPRVQRIARLPQEVDNVCLGRFLLAHFGRRHALAQRCCRAVRARHA